jgi:hypothetical protein
LKFTVGISDSSTLSQTTGNPYNLKKKVLGASNPKEPKQDSQIRLRLLMTKGDWPPLKKTLF